LTPLDAQRRRPTLDRFHNLRTAADASRENGI